MGGFDDPLPSVESANRSWSLVNDGDAWKKKFSSGLQRFGMQADSIPPALSEENMLVEKSPARRFLILASRAAVTRPRYDLRLYWGSPIVSIRDIRGEFDQFGGAWVYRGRLTDKEVTGLTPTVTWPARDGALNFLLA